MGKYKSILMMFIGFTIGGIIGYFIFGDVAVYKTLFLYLIICVILTLEIYLDNREAKGE